MMDIGTNQGISEGHEAGRLRAIVRRSRWLTNFALVLLIGLVAVQAAPAQNTQPQTPDYSANPKWFPNIASAYKPQRTPPADLNNSKALSEMVRDGRIELSLQQLAAAVIENNLRLAVDRYNNYFAQADLLRTKAGQASRGVQSAGAGIPDALFSAAI